MKSTFLKAISITGLCALLIACGGNKRHIPLNIHSDPLGAYTMIQVKYKGETNSDWIYLGATPIILDKSIEFDNAIEVSLKVIRPGFHERIKTWKKADFLKEYKRNKKIVWVPNMVRQ